MEGHKVCGSFARTGVMQEFRNSEKCQCFDICVVVRDGTGSVHCSPGRG